MINDKNMEQLTLSRYYDELPRPTPPKTEFVKRVAERCGVDTQTVRYWLRGDRLPGRESHLDILLLLDLCRDNTSRNYATILP